MEKLLGGILGFLVLIGLTAHEVWTLCRGVACANLRYVPKSEGAAFFWFSHAITGGLVVLLWAFALAVPLMRLWRAQT